MKLHILILLLLASAVSSAVWYPLGNWIEEEGTPDLAGYCVANSQDGKIIAVSAPHYAPEGKENLRFGRVVVYKFDETGEAWNKLGAEIIGEEGDHFGSSLGMSDDGKNIIVGSLTELDGKRKAGKVDVFILDNSTGGERWIPKGEGQLFGENAFDEYGYSVDIRDGGEIIAIGSPGEDNTINEAGAVRVYKWVSTDNSWQSVEEVIRGKVVNGRYGQSLSLSQVGIIAIGSPQASESRGMVEMIRYNATLATWVTDGVIDPTTAINVGDMFGYSVSLSFDGTTVAIGAPHHRGGDMKEKKDSGAVTVHKYDSSSKKWTQVGDEIVGNRGGDEAGTSVHLSENGNEVAFGSPYSSMNGLQSGHISVFNLVDNESKWDRMELDIDGKKAYSNLGFSVALSGDGTQVMGGAPTEGYATVYQLAETAAPTTSPTPPPPKSDPTPKTAKWYTVIFGILFIGLVVFIVFKITLWLLNRRSLAKFQSTAADDLELTPHGVPTDGETRDII
eukprot:scaffold90_cov223-Chaetoceros_neogracile.AAC.4